ncbi:MAG: DUF1987 domain-containing protein [Bacteroidia bacterium]
MLYIKATETTPLVSFNPDNGEFLITGKSITEDADAFFQPVIDWVSHSELKFPVNLVVDLEYFNISSSKRILYLLYKFNELVDQNIIPVSVIWLYQKGDEDMMEVGQDYAYMVNIPFEVKEIERQMAV